jgi:hypothetical protein
MEIIRSTRQTTEGLPSEPPSRESLEELAREGLAAELIRRVLEWKGEATMEYFYFQWDLRQDEVRSAVNSLEDVQIEQINAA